MTTIPSNQPYDATPARNEPRPRFTDGSSLVRSGAKSNFAAIAFRDSMFRIAGANAAAATGATSYSEHPADAVVTAASQKSRRVAPYDAKIAIQQAQTQRDGIEHGLHYGRFQERFRRG